MLRALRRTSQLTDPLATTIQGPGRPGPLQLNRGKREHVKDTFIALFVIYALMFTLILFNAQPKPKPPPLRPAPVGSVNV